MQISTWQIKVHCVFITYQCVPWCPQCIPQRPLMSNCIPRCLHCVPISRLKLRLHCVCIASHDFPQHPHSVPMPQRPHSVPIARLKLRLHCVSWCLHGVPLCPLTSPLHHVYPLAIYAYLLAKFNFFAVFSILLRLIASYHMNMRPLVIQCNAMLCFCCFLHVQHDYEITNLFGCFDLPGPASVPFQTEVHMNMMNLMNFKL